MVTRILWDTQYNQQAWITNATTNSFEVLLKAVKRFHKDGSPKGGIDCLNWFEEESFAKRFTWKVEFSKELQAAYHRERTVAANKHNPNKLHRNGATKDPS